MPSKVIYNVAILAVVWVFVLAAGVYLTFVKQPEKLERVEKAEKVLRLKQAELASLLSEQSASAEKADEALRKWRARYKVIPEELTSPEVVGYFNKLSKSGFESFDVEYAGVTRSEDYSFHNFRITGRGYFTDLYRVVWELENNRVFYRIPELELVQMDLVAEDPETGKEEMKVMVSFEMQVNAYFGAAEGMSAPVQDEADLHETGAVPVEQALSDLPPVPQHVLPRKRPAVNPFFPLILDQLPPNTEGLINVEEATLVSIVGGEAVFQEDDRFRSAGVGDDVYLGQITVVDPIEGRVEARLNKGGIIDNVVLHLQTGERYRQALGAVRLAPIE